MSKSSGVGTEAKLDHLIESVFILSDIDKEKKS